MAAEQSTVIGTFGLDAGSREVIEEFSRAVSRLTDKGTDATPQQEPPAPTITEWPLRNHAPVVLATCPHCGDHIEANPVNWEIVIDPTSTFSATSVRGMMQHEHDGGLMMRWPFVATYTPPPAPVDEEVIDVGVLDTEDPFAARLYRLADEIDLGMRCDLVVDRDKEVENGRWYFQITRWRQDAITGEMGRGYGGKAYLSPHATDSELIQTAFGLYKGYWEHEARETFVWRERRPFGPHISTEALWEVARRVDVRSAKHVEDRA